MKRRSMAAAFLRMGTWAYETLACRGELVTPAVRDVDFPSNGTGLSLIRHRKTDAEG